MENSSMKIFISSVQKEFAKERKAIAKRISWRRGYGIGPSQGRVKGPSESPVKGSTKRVQCEGPVKEVAKGLTEKVKHLQRK